MTADGSCTPLELESLQDQEVNTSIHPVLDLENEGDMSRIGGTRGTCPAGTGATLRFVAQFIEMGRTVSMVLCFLI